MDERWQGGWAAVSWGAFALALTGTLLTSPHTVVSLAIYYLLFVAGFFAVEKKLDLTFASGVFAFYILATLGLYWTQYLALPAYYGFSGGLGVGTDDSFFYSLSVPELPADFPVRNNYYNVTHPYSLLLRFFSEPMYAFYGSIHPLDLLFLNAAGLSLMPILVRSTARLVTGDEGTARIAFVLSLICPFTIANAVILIRDGLTATLFIAGVHGLVSRRFLLMYVAMVGLALLRLPQAVMLVGSLWLISVTAWMGNRSPWRPGWVTGTCIFAGPFVVAILAYLYLGSGLLDKLAVIQGLYRESFVEGFIQSAAERDSTTATFYTINQLALPLRLPLAFLFFFGAPHFAPEGFVIRGAIVPRQFLMSSYALMFIAYAGFFLRGIIRAFDARNALLLGIVLTYCVNLLILSQASMQVRHKVALMPLMYIVVAYGLRYRQRDAVLLGLLFSFGVGAVELLFNGYKLWIR